MADLIQITRGTAAEWGAADPVLAEGQQGWVTDTEEMYIGDGSTAWSGLTAYPDLSGVGGSPGDPVDDPAQWGTNLGYDAEWASGAGLPTGWAWVNQGTATATRTFGRCLLEEPTAAAGNAIRAIEQPIPSAGSFAATIKMSGRFWPPASSYGHFIHLRDSVSGKWHLWGPNGQGSSTWSMGRWEWSNNTTAGTYTNTITDAALTPPFWRIRKNSATSWDFQVSRNGVVWDTAHAAVNVTTFLGTAPTHIGFGLWRSNTVTAMSADWFRIR